MEVTFHQVGTLPVWTVGIPGQFRALASIRGYAHPVHTLATFKIVANPAMAKRIPGLSDLIEMDGFRALEHAQQWCRDRLVDGITSI